MNRGDALSRVRSILSQNNVEDAPLEAEILFKHVLSIDRARLFASLNETISRSQFSALLKLIDRRVSGEPSAYITGRREFYGLDFLVNRRTLIPRPETELLVEKALEICCRSPVKTVADVGTGCGNIAVSLAVNLPSIKIYATDISKEALKIAAQNATKHGVAGRIDFLQGNLHEPLPVPVGMIVANLPYVKKADLNPGFEPVIALDGGEDGLDKIRDLCRQAGSKLQPRGYLLLEIGLGQALAVEALLHGAFPSALVQVFPDLAGIPRIVVTSLT